MKKIYLSLLLIFTVICHAQARNTPNPDEQLQEIASINNLMGMSVIAVHDNKIVYSGYFGLSNYALSVPVTYRTLYRVASISKSVTALAFMQLYEQGLVGLDDDISQIMGYTIENPNHPGVAITPRMLLSHTSTLNDGSTYGSFLATTVNNPSPPSLSQLIVPGGSHFASNIWLNAQPGEYFRYSNLAYGVLGSIIEKISQTRFDVYVRENILHPLEISGSFNIHDISNPTNLAVLYRMDCGQWAPQADNYPNGLPAPIDYSGYVPGHNGFIFAPQGGLRISADDLTKIMMVFMNKGTWGKTELLSSETIELMEQTHWLFDGSNGNNYSNLFNSWGLGLHLITNQKDGDIVVEGYPMKGHSGEAYGLISDMYYNNDPDFGIIFITNGSAGAYFDGWNSAFYEVEEQVFAVLYNSVIAPLLTETFQVNVSIEGMGSTTPAPGEYTLNPGSFFDIEAQPDEGWQFEHFIINDEMILQPSFQFEIETNTQVKAVFSEIPSSTGSVMHSEPSIYLGRNNILYVGFDAWQDSHAIVEIFNIQGKQIFSGRISGDLSQSSHAIDLPILSSGTYISVVRSKNQPPVIHKLNNLF